MSNRPDYFNMKEGQPSSVSMAQAAGSITNTDAGRKVLRNTYALLAMTLVFSGVMAAVSIALNVPHFGLLGFVGVIGLAILVEKTKNSAMGLLSVFAFTGFMGVTLGPTLSHYLNRPGGSELVMMAMASTGLIFMVMSGWVLSTGKDLSNWGKVLATGLIVSLVGVVGLYFFQIPALFFAVFAILAMVSTAYIAYHTSAILHGGETNYISATVSLYVSLYNLFVSLLALFGLASDD